MTILWVIGKSEGPGHYASPLEPECQPRKTEKAPRERSFFRFLPYIYRISSPDIKHAKFVWVGWLVSGSKSAVVTLDFGAGA